MSFFKNKYYKIIFPLSIFITQCTEETVTFKYKKQINIYKTDVMYDEENYLLEKNIIFYNDKNFIINKKSNIDNLFSIENYIDENNNKIKGEDIKKNLTNYIKVFNFAKNDKKSYVKFDIGDIYKENYNYHFYFYKKLNFENLKFDLDNNEFKITFKDNITSRNIYTAVKDYKKDKEKEDCFYSDIIEEILNEICNDFNAENYFLVINKEEINYKDDNNNKEIYKNFIYSLLNNKEINVELKKPYHLMINEVLLSNDLTKIYKIDSDKGKELKNFLTDDYDENKYSTLQNELKDDDDYKNIKIKNGDTETEIDDLDNITIIITDDPDKEVIIPKKCTIKFEANKTKGLFIKDSINYPTSKNIEFSDSEGGITTDTNINDYINAKYPDIKDKCTITPKDDKDGKFEDGTTVTVTINEEIDGITTKKDPNKVYIKVQFKVSDSNKFKFKGNLAKTNEFNLEFEKNKKISNLLTKIKENLDNINIKDGYKIELNNIVVNNETELVDDGIYIITLANDDTNFIEEIKKEDHKDKLKDEGKDKHEKDHKEEDQNNNNNNNNNNDNNDNTNNKKCCYCNKKNKENNKEKVKCCKG